MKSIIQTEKECYICRCVYGVENRRRLECHHVFGGSANRKKSDKDGLTVWLCSEHHRGNNGVHDNPNDPILADWLKKRAQKIYMEKNGASVEDFIKRYGRSYL